MKKLSRIISVFLCVITIFASLNIAAFAVDSYSGDENTTVTVNEDSEKSDYLTRLEQNVKTIKDNMSYTLSDLLSFVAVSIMTIVPAWFLPVTFPVAAAWCLLKEVFIALELTFSPVISIFGVVN